MKRLHALLFCSIALAAGACMTGSTQPSFAEIGNVHREAGLDSILAADARVEKLAEGFRWTEGPVWIEEGRYLLFSDVPGNRIHRWSEKEGVSVFLEPSGYGGADKSIFREPGSNGLIRGPGNSILMADHGNRAVARLDLTTKTKTFLATHYQGKRFSSPNDLVLARNGSIYFTDPPYGLAGLNDSPHKELPHNGVYRLDPDGSVTLLDGSLSFPNGVILSPDERTLYVAVSDPNRAVIMAYDVDERGGVSGARVFSDMTALAKSGMRGLPDGMAIDKQGNLFATGPGGVHIFNPAGVRLGRIDTGTPIANCAFGEDGRTLFLASNNMLARIRTKARGKDF